MVVVVVVVVVVKIIGKVVLMQERITGDTLKRENNTHTLFPIARANGYTSSPSPFVVFSS